MELKIPKMKIVDYREERSLAEERFTQEGNPTSSSLERTGATRDSMRLGDRRDSQRRGAEISETDRKEIADSLAILLADSYFLYLKTQNYHWNVTGPNFLTLHTMFMGQYSDLALAIDLVAERIRALGQAPPGTFLEFSKVTSVKEEPGVFKAQQMIEALISDQRTLISTIRKLISLAQEGNDFTTVDLLTQRLNIHEKNAWMLSSSLG
jgi:starvation-inducible DNA-binding protein